MSEKIEVQSYRPIPRQKQRLGGILITLISIAGTSYNWHLAINQGFYYPKIAAFLPMTFILGLGIVLLPGYKEERIARGEDISQLQGIALLTPRWWGILGVSIMFGLGNWYAMTCYPG